MGDWFGGRASGGIRDWGMEFIFECVGGLGVEQFSFDAHVVCSSAGLCEQSDSGARIIFQWGAGVDYLGSGVLADLSGGDYESLGGDFVTDLGATTYLRLNFLTIYFAYL